MSELFSLWGCFLRGTVIHISLSAEEGAFSSSYHLMCKCVPPHRVTHIPAFISRFCLPFAHLLCGRANAPAWKHALVFPLLHPSNASMKITQAGGSENYLCSNWVWKKCGQGDSGRSRSWQSVWQILKRPVDIRKVFQCLLKINYINKH